MILRLVELVLVLILTHFFMSLNCVCPVSLLTPGNSMNFGCGAVGKTASDFGGGPTGKSKEGSVTTTLGVVISLVFLM